MTLPENRYVEIEVPGVAWIGLCQDCGCAVFSPSKHDEWHGRINYEHATFLKVDELKEPLGWDGAGRP